MIDPQFLLMLDQKAYDASASPLVIPGASWCSQRACEGREGGEEQYVLRSGIGLVLFIVL